MIEWGRRRYQIFIYLCIGFGILALLLPWGIANVDMTMSSLDPSIFGSPISGDSVHLSIWELNNLRSSTFSSSTELRIVTESARARLDVLTALARAGLIAFPIAILVLLPSSWRFLSNIWKRRIVIFLVVSIIALIVFLFVAGPKLTGPYIEKTLVEEVIIIWPVLLLMMVSIGIGIAGGVFSIFKR